MSLAITNVHIHLLRILQNNAGIYFEDLWIKVNDAGVVTIERQALFARMDDLCHHGYARYADRQTAAGVSTRAFTIERRGTVAITNADTK